MAYFDHPREDHIVPKWSEPMQAKNHFYWPLSKNCGPFGRMKGQALGFGPFSAPALVWMRGTSGWCHHRWGFIRVNAVWGCGCTPSLTDIRVVFFILSPLLVQEIGVFICKPVLYNKIRTWFQNGTDTLTKIVKWATGVHLRVIRLEFEKRLAKLQVKLSSGIVLLLITLSHSFKDLNDMFASRRDELTISWNEFLTLEQRHWIIIDRSHCQDRFPKMLMKCNLVCISWILSCTKVRHRQSGTGRNTYLHVEMELHIYDAVGIKHQLSSDMVNIVLYESVSCKINMIWTHSLLLPDGKGIFEVSLDLHHEWTVGAIGLSQAVTLFQNWVEQSNLDEIGLYVWSGHSPHQLTSISVGLRDQLLDYCRNIHPTWVRFS